MRIPDHHSREGGRYRLYFLLPLAVILFAASLPAQERGTSSASPASSETPEPASLDQQSAPEDPQLPQLRASNPAGEQGQSANKPMENGTPPANPQPQRILGIMPNFRAVSAGVVPPPPTPKQAFIIATKNSFDYSSFIFVGMTSLLAEATNTHSQLGKGVPGFGRYYWRGFADKTDGSYMVIFAMPTVFHQDERYYAMGTGSIVKRIVYSASRVIITPDYQGHSSFNASEMLGRGIAQAVSLTYYPSQTRTLEGFANKFGYAVGRDVLTNTFREFWPDIAVHVLHRHP
jgi:hypothetical protein